MFRKYFKVTKARIILFILFLGMTVGLQVYLTGPLVSRQKVVTEAGDSNSSVIGILDDTEVVRQKFIFNRKVVLNSFAISFASFKRKNVGDTLHIQMLDGQNNVVFETAVPVDQIKPNAVYNVAMDHSVTIPKDVACCIRMTCSAKDTEYALIPTINTTNRTAPNTFMSTLKVQTSSKSINISYTYSYFQIYPLFVVIGEFVLLFLLLFERLSDYSELYRKQKQKREKRREKERLLTESRMEARRAKGKQNASETIQNDSRRRKAKNAPKKHRYFSVKDTIKWCLTEQRFIRTVRIVVAVINPLILFALMELMNGTIINFYPNIWIFTWILLGGIQLLVFALIGNMNFSMLLMDLILFPMGLANLFIINVRGTPLLPADILGVQTGMEVASTYTFSLTPAQFAVLPAFLLWCTLIVRIRTKKTKGTKTGMVRRLIRFGSGVVPGMAIIVILYSTTILATVGIKDSVWNKVSSCRVNGFYMNFFLNMHYLRVSAPDGYSETKVAQILDQMNADSTTNTTTGSVLGNSHFTTNETLNGKKPNIILIMNESLADFSLLGDMNYNRDPLPFIHSMKENTIKGVDYVSVFGAGTSNSEFEAMTGNTMAYFPSGSNVYQQFMHESTFSLPSYLKELGYKTDAIHPSSGANWNRIATYKSMKFDQFLTIEDFKNPQYIRYISDKESYKKIIELYEKKKDDPMFVFDMTIQNHGGYLTNTNWKEPVFVEDSYYTQAKEYLSAIHVSDQAFEYLVDYFSKVDEPTIICMFGDHFPSIEDTFYEELLGKSQSDWDLTDIQKRYASPFVLWANYDIAEADQVVISNNYLENMILKQAGLELPVYNQYIETVSKSIPAMNVNGYMDVNGNWNYYNKKEPEDLQHLLNDYEILQYGYYSNSDKTEMGKLFHMKP